jgi:hypothetical protein
MHALGAALPELVVNAYNEHEVHVSIEVAAGTAE